MDNQIDPVLKHFDDFVKLRKTGTNRDDAWAKIKGRAAQDQQLQNEDHKRLFALAKEWERRLGHQYYYTDQNSAYTTLLKDRQESRHVGQLNPAVLHAYEQELEKRLKVSEPDNPYQFNVHSELHFFVRSHIDPLHVKLRPGLEMIIGRYVPGSAIIPDIDLNLFGADEHGVSRMHAVLILQHQRVILVDVGSTNGTKVNGRKLQTQEQYVLKDGEEVAFGELVCRIRFVHPK